MEYLLLDQCSDALTFLATLTGNIVPTTTSSVSSGAAGSMLGAAANSFAQSISTTNNFCIFWCYYKCIFSNKCSWCRKYRLLLKRSATTGNFQVSSSSTDTVQEISQITQSGDAGAIICTYLIAISQLLVGIFIDSNDADGESISN